MPARQTSSTIIKNGKLENARIKYQEALSLFRSEGQIQWNRYGAMLIINTIFIGLIGFTYSKDFYFPIFFKILFRLIPLLGLFLCHLWHQMTERGFIWMEFWISKGRELEKQIGDRDGINPINDGNDFRSKIGANVTPNAASWIIKVFALMYFLMLIGNVYQWKLFE